MKRTPLGLALLGLLVVLAGLFVALSRPNDGEAVAPDAAPSPDARGPAAIEAPRLDERAAIDAPSSRESVKTTPTPFASSAFASTGAAPAPTIAIEVLVLSDNAPAPGVRVDLEFDPDQTARFVERRSQSAVSDASGVAVFEISSYFRSAEAVVLPAPGQRISKGFERLEGVDRWRVELRLGSGRVAGVVFGLLGAPAPDAEVLLRCEAGDWFETTYSKADGTYAFDGVPAGPVQISTLTEPMSQTPGHRARVQVTAQATKRLDLGGHEPPRTWTGRLLVPSGAPLESPLELWAVERTREWRTQFSADRGGFFRFEIAPGDYDLFTDGRREPLALGALTIAEGSDAFRQDLVLPARIVYGSVNWSDDGSAVNGRELTLAAANDYLSVSIRGGRFCALALHDAEYMVSIHDEELADAPGGYVWVTTESGSEVQLHLRLVR